MGAVSFVNVESFVLYDRVPVEVPDYGRLTVSIAYGGDFYCFVDADAIGVELGPHCEPQMLAVAQKVIPAVNEQLNIRHPKRPDINRCYQTLLTSAATTVGDYRQAIMCPPGSLDRSPCGTGTSARVALLHTRGELAMGEERRFEGPLGTFFSGAVAASEEQDGILYVRPRVSGRAYLTGFHQFVLEQDDPLPRGFRVGPKPETCRHRPPEVPRMTDAMRPPLRSAELVRPDGQFGFRASHASEGARRGSGDVRRSSGDRHRQLGLRPGAVQRASHGARRVGQPGRSGEWRLSAGVSDDVDRRLDHAA